MGVTGWWIELISAAASTMRSPRAAMNGMRSNPIGVLATELQQPTASLTGLLVPTGAVAAEAQPALFEAASGLEGAADATVRSPTTALTSSQVITGTSTTTLQEPIAALVGAQTQSGSMAASMQKPVTAATGTHATAGIQFISSTSTTSTSVTMPAHQAGDLLVGIPFRSETTTAITTPAGWTRVATSTGNARQIRVAYKVAASSSETSGTWTNAISGLIILVYRNAAAPATDTQTSATASSATITYPAFTLAAVNGRSWILRPAFHATATNITTNTPAGYTNRATIGNNIRVIDSDGPIAVNPVAATQSVNSSGGWLAVTIEIPST